MAKCYNTKSLSKHYIHILPIHIYFFMGNAENTENKYNVAVQQLKKAIKGVLLVKIKFIIEFVGT